MPNYDLILNIINTILSGFSVLFIIFGWIIPYKQSQKQQKEQRKYEKSIKSEQYYQDKVDEQISKLYFPLYSLSMENEMQTNILLKKLNRNYVFGMGETINTLSSTDRSLWIDFVKNHFLPNLNRMREILNNNIYLILNSELPSSYQRFMEYSLKLNSDLDYYLNNPNDNNETLFIEENYPSDFDIYINTTLDRLLQLQRERLDQNHHNSEVISRTNFDANLEFFNLDDSETIVIVNEENSPCLRNIITNEVIKISSSRFCIGRDKYCNYVINNNKISRQHLMIFKKNGNWYIIDFNTMNGTYVNGKKISPNSKIQLHENDTIQIMDILYHFHL